MNGFSSHPDTNRLSLMQRETMARDTSVISYLKTLKSKEATGSKFEIAANDLYRRYIERVVQLAKVKLPKSLRRVADEEDVAQAVMKSFFRGVKEGSFLDLDDANDLWQVLVRLTENKAIDQIRRQTAKKRGAGKVQGESAFQYRNDSGSCVGSLDASGHAGPTPRFEPTPEFAAQVAEEFQRRVAQLEEADQAVSHGKHLLREIALRRFEGESVSEIADAFGCTTRTVERRLGLIRELWKAQS